MKLTTLSFTMFAAGFCLSALVLGCAEGKAPPPLTIGIPIKAQTITFGEELLCRDNKTGDAALCGQSKPPETAPTMQIKVKAFRIDEHEVTNLQYQHCVARGDCSAPRYPILELQDSTQVPYYDEESAEYAQHPVVNITWAQANDYCRFAGKRLPTEIEWETAARQNSVSQIYPWGDVAAECQAGPGKSAKKVALKGCNSSLTLPAAVTGVMTDDKVKIDNFTLHGMAGNVAEWTSHPYDPDLTCAGPITDLTKADTSPCNNAFLKCATSKDSAFSSCAANQTGCQDCRDEADETAAVTPACYGQCLDSAKPIWICQRHEGEIDAPTPEGDTATRSVRGGSYITEDLCRARFSHRLGTGGGDGFETATKSSPTIGFRCAVSF